MEELLKYLRASLILQLESLPDDLSGGRRVKALAAAGFTYPEIAELLGKTTAAVAKAVSRARGAKQERKNAKTA